MAVFGPGQHSQHIQNPQFETFESVREPMYSFLVTLPMCSKFGITWISLYMVRMELEGYARHHLRLHLFGAWCSQVLSCDKQKGAGLPHLRRRGGRRRARRPQASVAAGSKQATHERNHGNKNEHILHTVYICISVIFLFIYIYIVVIWFLICLSVFIFLIYLHCRSATATHGHSHCKLWPG